ncbi:hypothetical protein AM593_04359, partial [Mytilus galloprovincialis]
MFFLYVVTISKIVDLELLPPDAVLATLCFYIKADSHMGNYVSKEKATLLFRFLYAHQNFDRMYYGIEMSGGAIKTLEKLSSILLKLAQDSDLTIETPLRNYKIASNILDLVGTKYVAEDNKSPLCICVAEVFFISVDWFERCLKSRQAQGKTGAYTDHLLTFQKHRERLKNIMMNERYYGHEEYFLRVWNRALEVRIPDGEIKDAYIKFLRDELEQTLEKRSLNEEKKLVEIYCINLESFCDPIQEILSKLVFKMSMLIMKLELRFIQTEQASLLMFYSTSIRKLAVKCYIELGKSFFINRYIKNHDEYSKSLSSNSADLMRNFVEVLKQASEALSKGNILVQDLQRIMGKADHFKSIVTEIKDLPIKAEYLMASLPLREKELLAYQSTLKIVQDFMYMCTRFKGNTRDLEDRIKRFEKLENVSLNMLCKVAFLEDMKNHEQYEPTITAFGLDENAFQTIPYILKCGQGLLFITLWDRRGNELAKQKGKALDLDEILTEVWEPTYKFWDDLCTRLKNGNLKFSEFEKYFKTTDMETLRNELMKLCQDGNTKWIDV